MTESVHPSTALIKAKDPNGNPVVLSADANDNLIAVPYVQDKVSTVNSTTDLLGAGEVFPGAAEDTFGYSAIGIVILADQDSATDGVKVYMSDDAIDWHIKEKYTLTANDPMFLTPPVSLQYFKVEYTNGATPQGSFHIHTVIKVNPIKWSSHNLFEDLNDEDDAELTIAIPKLRTAKNQYTSMQGTTAGNAKVSLEEYNGAIATGGLPVTLKNNAQLDAFGRLRTSDTGQRFDVEFIYDKQPSLMDEITAGGATITHNSSSRDVTLAINGTGGTADATFVQHWANPYTPGNSQLIDITGTLDAGDIGGGTAYIFLKDGITSTETEIAQSSWNGTNVDDVDWTTSQIFSFDFQSLKVGRIRFNMVRDGEPVQVHEITNDNTRIPGYWQYPAQPLQWRIYNDGSGNTVTEIGYYNGTNGFGFRYKVAANANAELRAICGTVKSEGGEALFNMAGFNRHIDMAETPVTVSTTLIPILSIRMKSTFNSLTNRGISIPDSYSIQTDNAIRFVILFNPTLTGASWSDVDTTNSFMEYDTTATAVSGGIVIGGDYLPTGTKNSTASAKGLPGRAVMAYGFNSTSDIVTIAAIRTGTNNASVLASSGWREIR